MRWTRGRHEVDYNRQSLRVWRVAHWMSLRCGCVSSAVTARWFSDGREVTNGVLWTMWSWYGSARRTLSGVPKASMWSPLSQLMYAWWQCHGYEFIYLECHTWRAAWYRISLGCEITILSSIEAASGWTNLTSDIWLSWTERYFGEPTPSRGHTCELSCSNSAHQIVGLKPFWYQNGP